MKILLCVIFSFWLILFLIVPIVIFLKEKKKICILEFSATSNLDEGRKSFLKQLEIEKLDEFYLVVILQDDIVLDRSKYYFPKNYAYIKLSEFNTLYDAYLSYLNKNISYKHFQALLNRFIASKVYLVD